MRRFADLTIACALLGFTLPLIVVIAIIIKLDSPGPIFSRQERRGPRGRKILVLTFRTLAHDGHTGMSWGQGAALTRSGRFLRYSRLDDLPQLINVLRGEMTIIGPKPQRPDFLRD